MGDLLRGGTRGARTPAYRGWWCLDLLPFCRVALAVAKCQEHPQVRRLNGSSAIAPRVPPQPRVALKTPPPSPSTRPATRQRISAWRGCPRGTGRRFSPVLPLLCSLRRARVEAAAGSSGAGGASAAPKTPPRDGSAAGPGAVGRLTDPVPVCTQTVPENPRSSLFTPLCSIPQPQPLSGFGNG